MLYKDLAVWKKAHQLTLDIYKLTSKYPKSEMFGIISQIQRASSSVPANIVEGQSRKTKNEFVQFLFQARGSLSETQYFLDLSKDLGYITETEYKGAIDESVEVSKMLNSLIKSIQLKT